MLGVVGRSLLVVAVCLLVVGCGKRGSGKAASETRKVDRFDKIHVSGSAKLNLRVDPEEADGTVVLRGDDDVVPNVKLEVTDGALTIRIDGEKTPNLPLEVSAVVANLDELKISGAASGQVTDIDTKRFTVRLSGAAALSVTGRADEVNMKLSGAPSVDASRLAAGVAKVHVSGAGTVDVNATDKLEAHISGAGSVTYGGDPKTVDKHISGVGKIAQR